MPSEPEHKGKRGRPKGSRDKVKRASKAGKMRKAEVHVKRRHVLNREKTEKEKARDEANATRLKTPGLVPRPGHTGRSWRDILSEFEDMTMDELQERIKDKDRPLTLREMQGLRAVQIATMKDHPERQKCLEFLVNRTDGLPTARIETTGKDGGPIQTESLDLSKLPDEDLAALRAIRAKVIARASGDSDSQ